MLFFYVRDAHLCMSYSLHNKTLQTESSDETGGCINSMTSCSKIVNEYDQEIPSVDPEGGGGGGGGTGVWTPLENHKLYGFL